MEKQHQIFFDFLRFCIGSDSEIPSSLKKADWNELYAIAQKQALVGFFLMVFRDCLLLMWVSAGTCFCNGWRNARCWRRRMCG